MAVRAELPTRPRIDRSPRDWRDYLGVGIIVLVACVTRLTFLDLVEFKNDEATASMLAVSFLDGRELPLIGIISSALINNPPMFIYLLAIPLAISRDPAIAAGFIGLLGVGSVILTYRFCVEHFDRRTAQVAALLFAASPWAVILSRRLQAQDVVPFFTLLWISALFNFGKGRGAYHLVGVAGWLSVLLQIHQATVALVPLTVLALAVRWRHFHTPTALRWTLLALAVAAVIWVPYLAFQVTHHWADLIALRHVLSTPAQLSVEPFGWILDLAGSNGFDSVTGTGDAVYQSTTLSFAGIYLLEKGLVCIGLALVVGRLVVSRCRAAGDWRLILLLLWLVVPPLFFVHHTMPLFNHYFADVYPAQFILIGLFVASAEPWLARTLAVPWRRAVTVAASFILAAIVAAQVYGFVTVMEFVGSQPTVGGHDVPLREREAAMTDLIAAANGSATTSLLAAHGSDADSLGYLAGERITYKIFDDRDTLVIPTDHGSSTAYLAADPTQPAEDLLRQRFPDFRVNLVPFPGQSTGFEIYRLPPAAPAQVLHQPSIRPLARTASNGTKFLGYDVAPVAGAGSPLHVAIYWQVVGVPPAENDDAFFIHLVDDDGRLWAQSDGLGYPPYAWTVGDEVVSWFTLQPGTDLPAGRGSIEAGVYDRTAVRRLPLRADDGTTTDRLLLGPLKLVPAIQPPPPAPQYAQSAHFADTVDLRGYDLSGTQHPGGRLDVILTWSAIRNPGMDLASFVHLLDSQGRLVAQSDGQPGIYPTSVWQPGDLLRDERTIALPTNLAPATYNLEVGLYRRDNQTRLPTSDGGDHIILNQPVTVTAGSS